MVKRGEGPVIPRPGEGKRGEAGYFGYLLRQASGTYRLRMERALADLEVTPPQFTIMTMVAAYPGLSGADLARLTLLTPQTVSVIVANLERAGSVARRPLAYTRCPAGSCCNAPVTEGARDDDRHQAAPGPYG